MPPKTNNCAKCGRFTSRKDRKVNKTKAKCRLSAAVRQRIRQMQKLVPFQIMKRRRVPKMRPSSNQRGARAPRCRLGQEDALTKTTSSLEEEEIKVSPFIKGIRLGLKVGRQQYNQDPAMTAMSHDGFRGLMQTTQLPNSSALYSPGELLADNMTSSNQRGARAPPCRLRQKDALTKTPSMSALEEEIGISPFVKGLRLGLRHGRQEYNQDPTMTAMSLDGFKGRMQTTQLPNLSALYSPAELMAEERCSMPLNPLPPGFVPKSERGHNSSPQELQQDSKQELDEKSSEVSEPKRELPGSVSELAESVLSLMQDMSQNWSTDIRQSPRDVLKNDDRNDV